MAITTIMQTQMVDGVGSVVTTDIVQDPNTGLYTRQIRVYAPADSNGNTALLYTLQLTSSVDTNIEFTAPATQF